MQTPTDAASHQSKGVEPANGKPSRSKERSHNRPNGKFTRKCVNLRKCLLFGPWPCLQV